MSLAQESDTPAIAWGPTAPMRETRQLSECRCWLSLSMRGNTRAASCALREKQYAGKRVAEWCFCLEATAPLRMAAPRIALSLIVQSSSRASSPGTVQLSRERSSPPGQVGGARHAYEE